MKSKIFINDKEMFKAVCFAEKILSNGKKNLEESCEVAANYYKQDKAKVMEYVKARQ